MTKDLSRCHTEKERWAGGALSWFVALRAVLWSLQVELTELSAANVLYMMSNPDQSGAPMDTTVSNEHGTQVRILDSLHLT